MCHGPCQDRGLTCSVPAPWNPLDVARYAHPEGFEMCHERVQSPVQNTGICTRLWV